ncbi:MAG: glycosyltransferase family 9 protein, partial [Deltaproteobacteria bacterium]|nr:glycosyltransferase family 9 protein [Deltaproteobacteria bacterium]
MNRPPILILQLQRMGDLVLSFPLLGWLAAVFPGHPLWVVGEAIFFEPLLPLSPQATYFSSNSLPDFKGQSFHAVLNLSHRPEAAALAASVRAEALFGPYLDADDVLHIRGDWQIY